MRRVFLPSRIFLLSLLLVGLAGCASSPAPYGSFLQKPVPTHDRKMADDAVVQLAVLYPSAGTRFELQHATADFFGTYLVESLRRKGYAVQEFNPAPKPVTAGHVNSVSLVAPAVPATPPLSGQSLILSYILDQGPDAELYRLTLVINRRTSLSRLYQVQGGTVYPAGAWVRKE